MPKIKFDGRTIAAFSAGLFLAVAWYTLSGAVLSGWSAEVFPVIGAVIIAALMSAFAVRKPATAIQHIGDVSLAQQLRLLKTHTMVNVVDTQNLLVEVNDLLL